MQKQLEDYNRVVHSPKTARRVAMVYESKGYGGVEVYILNLVRHLDPARYSPVLVMSDYNYNYPGSRRFVEELRAAGVPVLNLPPPGTTRGLSFLREVRNIRSFFKKARIDVVHIHTCLAEGARRATLGSWLAGVPLLVRTEHWAPSVSINRYSRYTVKPFDWLTGKIVTVSEANRREQIELLHRSPGKVYRSYCGIEVDRYRPGHPAAEAKRRLGLNPAWPVIGTVGRLAEQKGQPYLIEATRTIIESFGPVSVLLVGEGPTGEDLRRQVAESKLEQYIHFTGFQPDPVPYLEAMDIAALPSLHEGFSLSLLEYMAMGKACVVTDYPSFKEALVDGESGLMVPVRDSAALAQALLRLLRDPALAARLGQAALDKVRQEFSVERMAGDMMDLYDRSRAGRQPGQAG